MGHRSPSASGAVDNSSAHQHADYSSKVRRETRSTPRKSRVVGLPSKTGRTPDQNLWFLYVLGLWRVEQQQLLRLPPSFVLRESTTLCGNMNLVLGVMPKTVLRKPSTRVRAHEAPAKPDVVVNSASTFSPLLHAGCRTLFASGTWWNQHYYPGEQPWQGEVQYRLLCVGRSPPFPVLTYNGVFLALCTTCGCTSVSVCDPLTSDDAHQHAALVCCIVWGVAPSVSPLLVHLVHRGCCNPSFESVQTKPDPRLSISSFHVLHRFRRTRTRMFRP